MSDMKDGEFAKNFSIMIGALALLTVVLIIVANVIGGKTKTASVDNKAIAERIKPVGKVTIASKVVNAVVPAAQAADGKATYTAKCSACHGTGAAGAPKLGDKAAWKARIAQGKATLYEHAIKGFQGKKGFMPAKGGFTDLSDAEVKAVVDHMVSSSK